MTTTEIANNLKVHRELVRDACGAIFQRCSAHDKFNSSEVLEVVNKLREWKKL
jgi:hypothetical protein